MRILIPEYHGKQILAAIRSLTRKKHIVTLAVHSRSHKPIRGKRKLLFSRHLNRITPITPPEQDVSQFIAEIIQLGQTKQFDVLLPFGNDSTVAVSMHIDELKKFFRIPTASYDVLQYAHNKALTFQLAHKIGISMPQTFYPASDSDVATIASKLTFPIVIKARKNTGVWRGLRYANNPEELLQAYQEISQQANVSFLREYNLPIIQEYIPGDIHDGLVLFNQGMLRAAMTQKRVYMYPITGGVGAVNITTQNPIVIELAEKLLREMCWHGPAQVEFKFDPRDETYKLIEVNPKLWGTLDLAIKAGIDFAELASRLAYEGDVPFHNEYKVGLKYRWLLTEETLSLIQHPNIARIMEYLNFFERNVVYDFSISDPFPDLFRLLSTLLVIKNGIIHRITGK